MSNLNFKYGPYANLFNVDGTPKTTLSEGTVYITTDERAMFVDLKKPNSTTVERIRIDGAIQYYDSVESFTAKTNPPYSKETLYFFRSINNTVVNSLMAFDGTEWVRVNVTLQEFEDLVTKVSGLEANIGTLTDLSKDVSDLQGTVASHTTDIDALKKKIGDNDAGDSILSRVTAIEAAVGEAESDISELNNAIAGLPATYAKLTDLDAKVDNKTFEDTIADFEETIETHALKSEVVLLTDYSTD
jgi:peptidoglycan hydrolase CwlO-like protein